MKGIQTLALSALLSLGGTSRTIAGYVSVASTNPVPPYVSWATAATNIQDAIDVAQPGEFVLVGDGTYSTGGRVVYDSMTNRVALTKPISVRSLNGPEVTVIAGTSELSGGLARCAYLTSGASLVGFTLTKGLTSFFASGAGVWCESTNAFLTNCILSGNIAYNNGGGAWSGTLVDCILTNNDAYSSGGGAYGSALVNCTIANNDSEWGGGASACTLRNCTVSTNGSWGRSACGGGVSGSTLEDCLLVGNRNNSQAGGGGAYNSTLIRCTLIGNTTTSVGGGAYASTLDRCVLIGNSAQEGGGVTAGTVNNSLLLTNSAVRGGGAWRANLTNCTIVGNTGVISGGGLYSASAYNCIVFYNSAATNSNSEITVFNYCLTTPLPPPGNQTGVSNSTSPPLFVNAAAGNFRLQAGSPGIDLGNDGYVARYADLDGRPRIVGSAVDLGAYEFLGTFLAWLQQYGLVTDGSADFTDADQDGMNNYQEFVAGTEPTNPSSLLKLIDVGLSSAGMTFSWHAVPGRTYTVERSPGFLPPAFVVIGDIQAQADTTICCLDPVPMGSGRFFYRLRVR